MDKYGNMPPVLLAYVGDAVFELLVRLKLAGQKAEPVRQLHREATRYTRAGGQSQALSLLEPHLTEEEADIARRGRNSKSQVPRGASTMDYRRATGLEALFGYLYMQGRDDRLRQLFELIDFSTEPCEVPDGRKTPD